MITPSYFRRGFLRIALMVSPFLAAGIISAQESSGSAGGKPADEVALIKTTKGDMVVKFWPEKAPKTVENFKKLASQKFYDGTAFHRIIDGFMIQGGDPNTKDPANEDAFGTGGPGYKIDAEFNDRKHVFGVISMARSAHPDSAGSQFFLMLGDAPFLDGKYTGFGQIIKGEDVLKTIGKTAVGPSRSGERSKPQERIEVKSVQIGKASELAK
jgi:peptidyl-prolyl cis-trans isomerase B (cyclophilin B)